MSDPDYASVSLLLHGDGANGSTTFVDSSATPKTVTRYGNAQISTAQSKFGGASMAFDGAGDYLSVPPTADFYPASSFTVESWVRPGLLGATQRIAGFSNSSGGSSTWTILQNNDNRFLFAGFDGAFQLAFSTSLAVVGTWVHLAGVISGGVLKLYVNGVLEGTSPAIGTLAGLASPLGIGRMGDYDGQYYQGHIEEFRVTNGVARYSANFTPATAPFAETTTAPLMSARAAAPTPLGAPAALATYGNNFYARAAAPGPLGTPATLVQLVQLVLAAHTAAPGPLGAPSLLAAALVAAYTAAPGPLGNPTALASMPLAGHAAAPSPLGSPAATAYHDFTGQLGDIVTRYTMDLITPTGTVRVAISTWQATLQTGSSNYVQCVIPACTMWVEAITTATEFVISRRATLPSGAAIELEMASAPADQAQFDQGPQRHTCTLSGYAEAFVEDLDPPVIYDRVLAGVRSISSGDSSLRVRCAIDWLLRPGHRAFVNGTPFLVGYINYYAPSGFDAYMDVGSRA